MKTVLITGASRGIGAAAAQLLSARGWAVAVNYCRSEERALALVDRLRADGGRAIAVKADVADPAQVRTMVGQVLEDFGQLDALVCNAGIAVGGLLTDLSPEQWRQLFAVNVDGAFHCCQAVLPHFVHRKAGRIVTLSSMWGQVGASCEVAYSASKAAVIGFTKALAQELGPSGITVNCVAPGVIDTEMNACYTAEDLAALAEQIPLGRMGTPEEAAAAIAFLLSDDASYLTGQVLSPNGGFVM